MKEENSNTKDQEVTVTQEELRELHELEEIQLKVNQLRKSIKNRVLNGAKVEPGKIKIFIETEWWIQTTKDGIREFLVQWAMKFSRHYQGGESIECS